MTDFDGVNDTIARENGIDPDAVAEEIHDAAYRNTKERFGDLLEQHRSNVLEQTEQDITEQQRIHDNYVRSMRNARWQMNELRRQREALAITDTQRRETIEAQFDALLRHDKVVALGIRNECLLIRTPELTMENPATGDVKTLGELEIVMPISSNNLSELQVFNKTNARTDPRDGTTWNHPHINEYAEPCFGSMESEMIDCLSSGEISGAFELLLRYVQTINPDDDYGSHWSFWE